MLQTKPLTKALMILKRPPSEDELPIDIEGFWEEFTKHQIYGFTALVKYDGETVYFDGHEDERYAIDKADWFDAVYV